jgi:hypothetical protein
MPGDASTRRAARVAGICLPLSPIAAQNRHGKTTIANVMRADANDSRVFWPLLPKITPRQKITWRSCEVEAIEIHQLDRKVARTRKPLPILPFECRAIL